VLLKEGGRKEGNKEGLKNIYNLLCNLLFLKNAFKATNIPTHFIFVPKA
jgi:hypothetical protein